MESPEDRTIGSATSGTCEAAALRIEDLTVDVAGTRLLESVHAEFPRGKVTLIAGPSGVGKTILLEVIAGLEDRSVVRARGRILGLDGAKRDPRDVGIVFQDSALFDGLSSRANIQFAIDHERSSGPSTAHPQLSANEWLTRLNVPADRPVRALSGGQAQRLALARTLAYGPPIVVFDEPTSGLDPAHATLVAESIRATARGTSDGADPTPRAVVVVTHDYSNLASYADRAYVVDGATKTLRAIEPEALASLRELPHVPPHPPTPRARQFARALARPFVVTGTIVEKAVTSLAGFLPLWRSPRWGLRFFAHFLGRLASPSAWLYFAIVGSIAGFVGTYFTFRFLPFRLITEPLIADEILESLGMILYRVVAPLLATVLMAARWGSAIASDIGSRSYSSQLDSLRSFGVRPASYLLTGILYALVIATPLLVAASFAAAQITSLLVFLATHPQEGGHYWASHFLHDLRIEGNPLFEGSGWLLAKILACSVGIGAIGYHVGAAPKNSSDAVSRGITDTVNLATIYVLVVHASFAFWEF